MKKLFLLSLLCCSFAVFADHAPNPLFEQQINEAIIISNDLKVLPQTDREENAELHYNIDVDYPQLVGENLTAEAKQFNAKIKETVDAEVKQFKNYVASDKVHMATLPEEARHNDLEIDYDIDILEPSNKQTIISVRLSIEGMQAGRAHPYHRHSVFNFDLTNGKVITLAELFKPKTNYLQVIAKYSSKKLKEKLGDKEDKEIISSLIEEGTKPTASNYQNWNLEDDDLLITFDEYRVAPYVYGAQEVEIPYSELKAIISPKAIIYPCVINPAGCKVAEPVAVPAAEKKK